MKTLRSKFHAPRPGARDNATGAPTRRTTGDGNNNADAYPHNMISNLESRLHPEDGQPTKDHHE